MTTFHHPQSPGCSHRQIEAIYKPQSDKSSLIRVSDHFRLTQSTWLCKTHVRFSRYLEPITDALHICKHLDIFQTWAQGQQRTSNESLFITIIIIIFAEVSTGFQVLTGFIYIVVVSTLSLSTACGEYGYNEFVYLKMSIFPKFQKCIL